VKFIEVHSAVPQLLRANAWTDRYKGK